MTTHVAAQAKDWYQAHESDVGNLQGVIGYLPAAHGLTLVQNDTIQMVKIPLGATVIDVMLETGALGGSTTASVGDDGDTNRYINAANVAANSLTRKQQTDKVGIPTTYAAGTTIDVLLEGDNPADDKAIRLDVLYVNGLDTTP